jgi:hypothetical protein
VAERPDVVAITAAMLHPVVLTKFAERYPDRVWDVGIAEQHAAVSAAGLATGGLHPVFLAHAKRGEVLAGIGLTPVEIAGRISAAMAVRERRAEE